MMRVPGFRTGKAGIEKSFDAELRGQPGTIKYEVDAHGRVVGQLGATPSVRGKDMALTIDQDLQAIALKRIEGLRIASIVVLDAVTGAILVLASYPTFDPNDMSFRVNLDRWKELARNKDHPLENRALRGVYPPGSTFKVVTALAGLEAGVITADEHMTCPGAYMFGRHRFRCWKRHGPGIDVHQAIKQSCDVYFYETANRLGIDRLAATARALGLGQIHDLGLVGQKQAIIPDTAWKKKALRQPWYPGETISCGIGQGYVSATPLQLAVVAARIATGRAVSPHLIAKSDNAPEPALLDVDPAHLELVRAGMVAVVNEPGGTAVRSALAIPDMQMAGKTGTSQVISAKNRGFLKGWEGGDARFVHRLRAGRRAALRRGLRRRAWRRRIACGGSRREGRDDRDIVARPRGPARLLRQQSTGQFSGPRRGGGAGMKALFAEGVERPQLLLKKKLLLINWPFLALITAITLVGVAALYSVAGGSLEPWASRHVVRYCLGLGTALRRRALRHPLVASRGLSALCRSRSSCLRW